MTLSAMLLSAALSAGSQNNTVEPHEQALVALAILKDGAEEAGSGAVTNNEAPAEVRFFQGVGHIETHCGANSSTAVKILPNGYLFRVLLVGSHLNVHVERHVPLQFDEKIRSLRKGQCMEAIPSDQVVLSVDLQVEGDTRGSTIDVPLGDGYAIRYKSQIIRN